MSSIFKKFGKSDEESKGESSKKKFPYLSFSKLSSEPKPDLISNSSTSTSSKANKSSKKSSKKGSMEDHRKVFEQFAKKNLNMGRSIPLCIFFFVLSIFWFGVSFFMLEIIAVSPYKFVMAFTLGSMCLMASLAFLSGTYNFLKKLVKPKRIVFTGSYFASLAACFFFSVLWKNLVLMIIATVWQAVALLFFVFSTVPGGATGLKMIFKMGYIVVERCFKKVLRI
ncbi:unnamed protein product [Moneuplotes crassus]|uniref:Vesicle transport protein n=1 Tax=Euplotes crassus TaxID=5936 RepID=A0AAD1XVW5_EUPCR|nr:unnamed protein product [Moneuplotes crassus]